MAEDGKGRGGIKVRLAGNADRPAILDIFLKIAAAGDTYPYAPETSRTEAECLWFAPHHRVYAAVDRNNLVYGHFYSRANQPALGDYVANAGFMVDPVRQGKGVGRILGEAALDEARRLGYRAMQFNLVVATNTPSVKLWQKLGFRIIGTLPDAFRHAQHGAVDAHVMFRQL